MNIDTGRSRREFMTAPFRHESSDQEQHDKANSVEHSCLVHVNRRAMACQFEVVFNHRDRQQATEAAVAALDLVDQYEDQLSVYRSHSELSQLNRNARRQVVPVEQRLFHLLKLSIELHDLTDGAFDITSTPLSNLWGFSRGEGQLPSDDDIQSCLDRIGSKYLEMDDGYNGVQFAHPELEINLNGIGKGYTLDRCREYLVDEGIDDFLLQGGRSSVIAVGSRNGSTREQDGWKIALRHPLRPDERILEFDLVDAALGTSGSATQCFYVQGKRYGHILDPRSGWPATGVLSATVLAPEAALADALSTSFYVMGPSQAMAFCSGRPDLAAILIVPGDRAGGISAHIIGIPDDHVHLCARTSFPIERHD